MTALSDPSKDSKEVYSDVQKAMALPIGAASPLWLMFAGAASVGVAYWWFSRWSKATNLEAALAPALTAVTPAAVKPETALVAPEVLPPAVVEAFEAAADVAEETVLEPVAEATPEPLIEVAPTPKPKTKAAAARAAPRTTSGPTRRS